MSINLEYISKLKDQIENVTSCSELQLLTDKIINILKDQLSAVTDQIAALEPLLALLSPPSLDDVPTWISDFIAAVIEPMVKPLLEYPIMLAELLTTIEEITALIDSMQLKFPDCSIVIPTADIGG